MIQVQWTCSSIEEARNTIRILLEKKLIACANIVPKIESHYVWEGKPERGEEVKVYLKTFEKHFDAICSSIVENGSYDVPEISYTAFSKVYPPYLDWAKTACGGNA